MSGHSRDPLHFPKEMELQFPFLLKNGEDPNSSGQQQSEEDRISDLPDSLLYHILSFLPTKDAAVTTILSKRWKPLALSQFIINFDHKTFPNLSTLRKFFKSFIAKRNKNLPIHSFNFKYHKYSRHRDTDTKIFANIVNIALKQGIQNLNLDTTNKVAPTMRMMELPSCILSCKNLVVLKLKSLAFCNDPHVVDLPSLKVLHLESVKFVYYDYFLELLSGCSILDDLEIKDLIVTTHWGVLTDKQINTRLWNLVTANICDDFVPTIWFDWFPNVERLHASLVLKEKFPCTFDSISMFHNLTNIEFIIHSLNFLFKFKCLIKLLQHCPKLQSLIIDERIIESKCHNEDWEEPEIVPKCLLFHLTTCSLRNYIGIPCELHFAKYIMKNSKVLNAMTIRSDKFLDANSKIQMLMELNRCRRSSATCELLVMWAEMK